jgi:hypothetical protein
VTCARVVVLGIVGWTPFAGVAWQALHYLEGLRRVGCDVVYVEDTGAWPYDPERNEPTDDPRFTVRYIDAVMRWAGFGDAWAYVGPDRNAHGPRADALDRLWSSADALVNVTGATVLRDEHLRVPVRIYLETDPVLAQIEVAQGRDFTISALAAHTHHFSFGENLGTDACPVPVERFRPRATRQPIVVDWWTTDRVETVPQSDRPFTTVSSWRQTGKDIEWNGETYLWSKHLQFMEFVDLPQHTPQPLELALACDDQDVLEMLRRCGWRVVDALPLSTAILPYRDYIRASRGEFTVAKDQYVRTNSGWFSDRSASYLAAGKPVITQDTGFARIIPTGEGLFAFTTLEEIVAALDSVASDYELHASAARAIAEEFFAAERVVTELLDAAGL